MVASETSWAPIPRSSFSAVAPVYNPTYAHYYDFNLNGQYAPWSSVAK